MSSVGEGVPPDRGRNSLDVELDEISMICQTSDKTHATKRHSDSVILSQKKKTASAPLVAASSQHTYTIPGFEPENKIIYTEQDSAPFIVHVARTENDVTSTSNNMRALKIAQLIYNSNIPGVDEIKSIGRNKVSVIFKSFGDANTFASNPVLLSHQLTASIPRYQLTRMGVVRQIPVEWPLEELVQSIECRSGSSYVIKARRLNKKKKVDGNTVWEPTGTVVLTFLGQSLPKYIYCYSMSIPVEMYTLPTIQCHKCCRFGHVRDQCRSAPRCSRCAGPHDYLICNIKDENVSCLYCSGNHAATEPNCPEHSRQKSIKIDMSRDNISYTEAAARFPRVRKSFVDIVNASLPKKPVYFCRSSPVHVSPPNPSELPEPHPSPVSYKRPVFVKRRPKPQLAKSFDHQAHNDITATPPSSFPNGCAISNQSSDVILPNENLAELLTLAVVNIFSKFGELIPNNVLQNLQTLTTSLINSHLKNGQELHSVEL